MRNDQERAEFYRFPAWAMVLLPVVALLIQANLPLWIPAATVLDLALLMTIYFACNRRSQIVGLLTGAVIGLAQDSLGGGPIGVYGIVKTVVGYLASSLGARIDVDHPGSRLLIVFGFYYIHLGLFLLLGRVLLEREVELPGLASLAGALVNAVLAVIIFQLMDRLREKE